MIIKDKVVKLEPNEYIIHGDSPLAKDVEVFIKGHKLGNVMAVIYLQVSQ